MGLPNQLSVLRILLVPGIIASLVYYSPEHDWLRLLALGLFVFGMVTDALDGFIARTQGLSSQLGALLDPIADKILIVGTLLGCSSIKALPEWMHIPAWFNLIVLTRDALVLLGALVVFLMQGRWGLRPDLLGKFTTVAQMLVIPTVMLHWPVKDQVILTASILTTLSAVSYLRLALRLFG